jgi:Cu+-exporting ATPase
MEGRDLKRLEQYLEFSKASTQVVKWSFSLSFLYNGLGLIFATTGALSPIVAAILMPISSISTVLFVTSATHFMGKKIFKTSSNKKHDMIQIMSNTDEEHSLKRAEELALTS